MNTLVLTQQGLIYRVWSVDCEEGNITYTCVKQDEPLPVDVESAIFITVPSDEVIFTYQDNGMSAEVIYVMHRIVDTLDLAPKWDDYVHNSGLTHSESYRHECIEYAKYIGRLKQYTPVQRVIKNFALLRNQHRNVLELMPEYLWSSSGRSEARYYLHISPADGAGDGKND